MTTQSTTVHTCAKWQYRRTSSGCLITANGPDSMYGYAIEPREDSARGAIIRSSIDWD